MPFLYTLYTYPVQTMNKENGDLYVSIYCYNSMLNNTNTFF